MDIVRCMELSVLELDSSKKLYGTGGPHQPHDMVFFVECTSSPEPDRTAKVDD